MQFFLQLQLLELFLRMNGSFFIEYHDVFPDFVSFQSLFFVI